MPLENGHILLDKYRIEQLIGEGTFGYVYQATDLEFNRTVAVKQLKSDLGYESDAFQRFVREADAAREIIHPNVVTGYAFETTPDGYYLIMEYMNGGSLADLLQERGCLTPEEAVDVTLSVLDALVAVHPYGIVHRDIKPSNILFSQDGTVKLGDFGIARIPISGENSLTQAGMVIGTVNYMSPEQARGERVDARSDLYAVGAVLYQMLAGYAHINFGRNFFNNLELIKNTTPLPLPPTVPKKLAAVVGKALAKTRETRYQTAADMFKALARAFPRPGGTLASSVSGNGLQKPVVIALLLVIGVGLMLCCLAAAAIGLYLYTRTP
jgi:eukaryotic-like serine/threonine-protein kinase